MIAISQALSAALLHFVWQGTAVAFLLWIALLLLRNRTPAMRYAASCAALVLMAALPAATIWILYERPVSLSASIAFVIPPAARAISWSRYTMAIRPDPSICIALSTAPNSFNRPMLLLS